MSPTQEPSGNQAHDQGESHCRKVLEALLKALQDLPGLNDRFSRPQRMQVRTAERGEIRHQNSGRCSVDLTVQVGETTLTYVLAVHLEQTKAFAVLRDEEGLVEHFDLSDPQEPFKEKNIQALHEALAVDIASHFGTDS